MQCTPYIDTYICNGCKNAQGKISKELTYNGTMREAMVFFYK